MNRAFYLKVIVGALLLLMHLAASANDTPTKTLNIAVASNFIHPFNELKKVYETQTGITIAVSNGSTGQLYHQIRFGAPYDIFLSADRKTSQRLIKEDLALASSYFVYGRGRIVLWSWDQTLMLGNGKIFDRYDKNRRFAIANPKLAPYGKATKEVLVTLGADKQWQDNMIVGQNISQTYQFVASRNVDMGFISLAQLRYAEQTQSLKGKYWLVPENFHQAIEQTAVILNASNKPLHAMQFLDFLKTPKALAIMQQYGYE